MDQFSDPVVTHPRTNEVEVPPQETDQSLDTWNSSAVVDAEALDANIPGLSPHTGGFSVFLLLHI